MRQRHPWVFSGAVARVGGNPAPGSLVDVLDAGGSWLARGYYNPRSQIVVRLLTWTRDEPIDAAFWRKRIAAAAFLRESLELERTCDAFRLAFAESDGLPGLIVDRYGDWLATQFLTLGVEQRREMLIGILLELFEPAGIVDCSDVDVRKQEGLGLRRELVAGRPPPEPLVIREGAHRFLVDLLGGQKTGFYIDQRENRRAVAALSVGRRILNAFSYTGAFGIYALSAGASRVTNIDASQEALAGAEATLRLNGLGPDERTECIAGDVFQVLRTLRDSGERFDMVILDPPKFARRRGDLDRAARGYKDINLQGLKLLAPGGILVTFSCSGLLSADLFQKIVFGASVDAGRDVQILVRLSQGPDHPVLLSFPESEYLKGLICRVS